MTIEQYVLSEVKLRPGYCTRALYMRCFPRISLEQFVEALRRLKNKGLVWKSANPQGGWYWYRKTKLVPGWSADPTFREVGHDY